MTDHLKRAQYVTDLLSWFSLYFAILSCALYFASGKSSQFLLAFGMLLPFAATIYLCIRVKKLPTFVGFHIGLIVLIWLLLKPALALTTINAWLLTAAIVFQMILFLVKRIRRQHSEHFLALPPVLAVLFFVLWIFAEGMKLPSLAQVMVITACIYMLCALLGIYLSHMLAYIESHDQMANMPVSALIRSGNEQMTVFMLLGAAVVLLFTHMGLDRLLKHLKNLLLSGIRFLFSSAPNNTQPPPAAAQTTPAQALAPPPMAIDEGGTSPVMAAISDIFMTVIQITLILAAVLLIIYTIYQVFQRFHGFSLKKEHKKKTSETEDVIEKLKPARTRRNISLFNTGLPEDKIRRIYYKKIQSRYKKTAVDPTLTPQKLTASIHPADAGAAEEFTRIYEQTRYGREPKPADIPAYKNLAKKL